MTALALLAAPVWAQGEGPKEPPGKIPEKPKEPADDTSGLGRIARGQRDAPAFFVRLREGGVLQVKVGEEWKDATLDGFAAHLRSFEAEELRKEGKPAREGTASRLFVSIDAEPTIPWQNVQWVMTVAAEQKYSKLEMSDGTRSRLVFLPVDRGRKPEEIRISAHAVVRGEKPAKWGNVDVLRPAVVRFRIGEGQTSALAEVTDYVRKEMAAAEAAKDVRVTGEIRAGNKVPFAMIFDLMEAFEAAELTSLEFYGPVGPTPAQREAARLPYPLKNYDSPTPD